MTTLPKSPRPRANHTIPISSPLRRALDEAVLILRFAVAIVLLMIIAGCADSSGPPTTDTRSDALPSLNERIVFLERYVTFRRAYADLDFHAMFYNGGGISPGPSEWDVRIIATVPPEHLAEWIPPGVKPTPSADHDWLADIPGAAKASGIHEWYADAGRLIGIDREKSIVAYRAWAN